MTTPHWIALLIGTYISGISLGWQLAKLKYDDTDVEIEIKALDEKLGRRDV